MTQLIDESEPQESVETHVFKYCPFLATPSSHLVVLSLLLGSSEGITKTQGDRI